MSVQKIAFVINGAIPFKIIAATFNKFPNSYVYLLNPSFDTLEKVHESLLKEAQSIGVRKYALLSKLCYFNDLQRQEECTGIISHSSNGLAITRSNA